MPEELSKERKGGSVTGKFKIIMTLFVASILIYSFFLPRPFNISNLNPVLQIICAILLVFGIAFIINGWQQFSLLQTIENMPTAKIDGAAEGLNEIQGKLAATALLIAPLSSKPCVLYKIELQLFQSGDNGGWKTITQNFQGVPTLLFDGTGYLAIDLPNAEVTNPPVVRYYLYNEKNEPLTTKSPEYQILTNIINNDFKQLSNLNELKIKTSQTKPRQPGMIERASYTLKNIAAIALIETILPTDQDYFAVGSVTNLHQRLNDKPVKAMTVDANTKLLSLMIESKKTIEKNDKTLTYISFILGSALLIISAAYFIGL